MCQDARSLGVETFHKFACTHYKKRIVKPSAPCGTGNLHCKHTPDGELLEYSYGVVNSAPQRFLMIATALGTFQHDLDNFHAQSASQGHQP